MIVRASPVYRQVKIAYSGRFDCGEGWRTPEQGMTADQNGRLCLAIRRRSVSFFGGGLTIGANGLIGLRGVVCSRRADTTMNHKATSGPGVLPWCQRNTDWGGRNSIEAGH